MPDARSFITTRPTCAPCPRCGRLQLTGHAEGLAYRVDPLPITAAAELAARQAGRSSYALIAADSLAYRNATRISGDVRGRPPVLASHACELPPQQADADAAHVGVLDRLVRRAQARQADNVPAPVGDADLTAMGLFSAELGARVLAADFDPHDAVPPF